VTKRMITDSLDMVLRAHMVDRYEILGIKVSDADEAMAHVRILEADEPNILGDWAMELYLDSDVDFRGEPISEWAVENEEDEPFIAVSEYTTFVGRIL